MNRLEEDLRKWFGTGKKGGAGGGGWDRYNTKGERIGKCAREPGEGKPKCLSKEKAAKMSKAERGSAVRRKRRNDSDVDRPGTGNKPINVSNKIGESVISECWSTHVQQGFKMKGGKRVPNCVPRNEGKQMKSFLNFIKDDCDCGIEEKSAAWQRKAGKNSEGGLNAKGRASYERENPGSDLKAPVSAKTASKNPDGKAAGRRKSFCARMGGMKGPMKDEKGRPTRKALALRKWDC